MSLIWLDGFETWNDAADLQVIDALYDTSSASTGDTYGRKDRGLNLGSQFSNYYMKLPNTHADNTTVILGCAYKSISSGNWNYDYSNPQWAFYDTDGNRHVSIHSKGSSRLFEVRDYSEAVIGTGTFEMILNVWYYIEIKVAISDTVGVVQMRFNEQALDIDLSGQDTLNGSNGYVGRIRMYGGTEYKGFAVDDLYVCNAQGTKNNDFLGDVRIDAVRPDGDGNYTDFDPSAGSNYENVDETYPDDDTTYNDSQDVAAGEQDSYAMESLDVLGTTIHGVKDQITVRKTDSGARSAKILTVQGGSDYLGDTIVLSDSFTTHTRIMEDNPDDAAAFVEADITSGEVGVEVTI